MRRLYCDKLVRLYGGDMMEALRAKAGGEDDIVTGVTTIITDPPYIGHGYLQRVIETREIRCDEDAQWSARLFEWVGSWWCPLHEKVGEESVTWVFVSPDYIGFYIRWARLTGMILQGIFACPPDELLLAYGPVPIARRTAEAIAVACLSNTYGQNKPIDLLRAIVRASPPGTVFDPFTGLGSTLDAARREGRMAVGIEVKEDIAQRAAISLMETAKCTSS